MKFSKYNEKSARARKSKANLIYYTIGFDLTCARGFCIIFGKFQERSSEHTRARDRSTLFTLLRPCVCNNLEGPKFRLISSGVTLGRIYKIYAHVVTLALHSPPLSSLLSPLSSLLSLLLTWPVATPCNIHRSLLLYRCQCH